MSIVRSVKDVATSQFEVVPEGELSSVIDMTSGRPVCPPQMAALAEIDCNELNAAAAAGPQALAYALGAVDPE